MTLASFPATSAITTNSHPGGGGNRRIAQSNPFNPHWKVKGVASRGNLDVRGGRNPSTINPSRGDIRSGGDIRRGIYSLLFFFPAPSGPEFFDTLEGSLNSLARIKSIELSLPILETRGLLGSIDDWTYAGKDDWRPGALIPSLHS